MSDVAKLSMSLDDIIATHKPVSGKGAKPRPRDGKTKFVPLTTVNKPAQGPRKGLNKNRKKDHGSMDVDMDYGAPAPKQQKARNLASAPVLGAGAPKHTQQRKAQRPPKTVLAVRPQVQKQRGGQAPRNNFEEQHGGYAQVSKRRICFPACASSSTLLKQGQAFQAECSLTTRLRARRQHDIHMMHEPFAACVGCTPGCPSCCTTPCTSPVPSP